MQHIDTISYSTSSGASLSAISLTDININDQVTVTEPHDYTEEGPNQMIGITDSMQHIDTTSHSSSTNKASI